VFLPVLPVFLPRNLLRIAYNPLRIGYGSALILIQGSMIHGQWSKNDSGSPWEKRPILPSWLLPSMKERREIPGRWEGAHNSLKIKKLMHHAEWPWLDNGEDEGPRERD
jgi:hypothetical protein